MLRMLARRVMFAARPLRRAAMEMHVHATNEFQNKPLFTGFRSPSRWRRRIQVTQNNMRAFFHEAVRQFHCRCNEPGAMTMMGSAARSVFFRRIVLI